MCRSLRMFTLSAMLLSIAAGSLRAQDTPVALNRIPKTVVDALMARFPNARIDNCTSAREGGNLVYDIEFTRDGGKWEADITAKGVLINYEKAIDAGSLPKAVSDTVAKRYPKATFKEVMEETEVKGTAEKVSAYEIVLATRGKNDVEVRVSPDGRLLDDTTK